MAKIIADVGSCWGWGISTAMECIDKLADAGVKHVKFQLCKAAGGNVPLPMKCLKPLVERGKEKGVSVSASIWGYNGLDCVKDSGATWIKFAHSAYREGELIQKTILDGGFEEIIITKPLMEPRTYVADWVKNLWTYEVNGVPVYPVTCKINHRGMYGRYNGFSCHALDWRTCLDAVRVGAEIIEVHVNPIGYYDSPDAMFALKMPDVKRLVDEVKYCV